MVSRGVALFLIFMLGSTCLVLSDTTDFAGVQETTFAYNNHIPSYVPHGPFNITSDTDFETQSWPGNGSAPEAV